MQDQHQAEKKIWIDPELTFMPMEKIKSSIDNNLHHHEYIKYHPPSGVNDDNVNYGS